MTFDYKNYLLEQLNIVKAELGENDEDFLKLKIDVAEERSFKMPKEPNTLLFIIKKISGSYVLGIKTQPIQILCYSEMNSFDKARQILELFTKLHQNEQFYVDNTLIKQNYDTPVILQAMLQVFAGYKASIYCYGTYITCDNLSDIKALTYVEDNKEYYINNISATISYAAVLHTSKDKGKELSESEKQESGVVLTLSMLSDNSKFSKLCRQIMLGEKQGNIQVSLKFKWGDEEDSEEKHTFTGILSNIAVDTNVQAAPALKIVITH